MVFLIECKKLKNLRMKKLILLIFVATSWLTASLAQVVTKTELSNVVCINDGIQVELSFYVRSADEKNIEIKNQNYRVVLGLAGIIENSFELVQEGVFSGFGFNGNNRPYVFSPNTLTGSKANQISYNIECPATDGYVLTNEFVLIGSIRFKSDATQDCFSVIIKDASQDYFSSFLESIVDDESVRVEDVNHLNFNYCLSNNCPIEACPDYRFLSYQSDDILSDSHHIKAGSRINASNVIHENSEAIYNAKTEVILMPKFEVKKSATFEVILEGCSN